MSVVIGEPGSWSFENSSVAENFDEHVREQLPWYDVATSLICPIARQFVPQGGLVYDLGAGTGNVGRLIADVLKQRNARLVAIESSSEMASRYLGPGELVVGNFAEIDLAAADLVVCFLVLMFLPVAGRHELIERLKMSLRPGGALVIFDKMPPVGGEIGLFTFRLALSLKYLAGVHPREIVAKELSLMGVQRPLSESELDGCSRIFQVGDFGGWLYVRS